jgi:hypothetical protein
MEADYAQKNADFQAEYNAATQKLKQERSREAEEYGYNLKRTREKVNNAWADEKAARETALEEQVAAFPATLSAEKDSAVVAAVEAARHEFEHEENPLRAGSLKRRRAPGRQGLLPGKRAGCRRKSQCLPAGKTRQSLLRNSRFGDEDGGEYRRGEDFGGSGEGK